VFKFLEPKLPEDAAKTLIVACSSDRGLCGAIHSTVAKPVKKYCAKNPDTTAVLVIGDKPRSQIAREARKNIVLSFNSIGKNIPTYSEASSIVDLAMSGKVDFGAINVYYNKFNSVISYELDIIPIFTEQAISASGRL
jgi:F-type H+-transporting ATPase subunit gamma